MGWYKNIPTTKSPTMMNTEKRMLLWLSSTALGWLVVVLFCFVAILPYCMVYVKKAEIEFPLKIFKINPCVSVDISLHAVRIYRIIPIKLILSVSFVQGNFPLRVIDLSTGSGV